MTDADGAAPAVLVERRGNVLVITINRPEARNAINAAVSIGIGDALEEAQHDPDVRAVVLTGSGDRSFCAGADLKAIARRENLYHPDHGEWGFAGYVHHFIDKPTIAAVNGTALGGGTELALASDLVVADELAKFGLPEVKRGLIAAAGGVFRIVDQLRMTDDLAEIRPVPVRIQHDQDDEKDDQPDRKTHILHTMPVLRIGLLLADQPLTPPVIIIDLQFHPVRLPVQPADAVGIQHILCIVEMGSLIITGPRI